MLRWNWTTSERFSLIYRSTPPDVFLEKSVLRIFSKVTEEHSCRSVISIKLLYNFLKIALWHGYSCVDLQYIFYTTCYKNIYGALLLDLGNCQFMFQKYYWFRNTDIFSYLPKTDPLTMLLRTSKERESWSYHTARDHVTVFSPGINICNNQWLETLFGNLTK